MLEFDEGFAYIGKEYHLNINGDDFYIDLLFYNLKLHSYIVIELKSEKFKPEHLGQLNFFVTAVNRELKTDRDNATIGLLICKDKNDVVCEYSLEQIFQPIGISFYYNKQEGNYIHENKNEQNTGTKTIKKIGK